jgi:hypothetical protein
MVSTSKNPGSIPGMGNRFRDTSFDIATGYGLGWAGSIASRPAMGHTIPSVIWKQSGDFLGDIAAGM